jgi:hypothetical protein
MATNQPARDGAAESMAEFVRRRNREQAARSQTHTAGHEAYGRAIRGGQDLELKRPGDVAAHGAKARSGGLGQAPTIHHPELEPNFDEYPAVPVSHPGALESFIPVWGSGREALADLTDKKPLGAALNGALAVSDLALISGIGRKLLVKGGAYALRGPILRPAAEAEWRHVRGQMRDAGLIKKVGERFDEGHHWFIAQRHDWVPAFIRNHPGNVLSLDTATHARLRHSYKGQPRFGLLERYWRGTPHWSKVATGSATGHLAATATAKTDAGRQARAQTIARASND